MHTPPTRTRVWLMLALLTILVMVALAEANPNFNPNPNSDPNSGSNSNSNPMLDQSKDKIALAARASRIPKAPAHYTRVPGPGLNSTSTSTSTLTSTSILTSPYASTLASTCVFTISAWNNFGFVKAFFFALAQTNPYLTCRLWVVADRANLPRSIAREIDQCDFKMVTVDDLRPFSPFNLNELAMRFDMVEFATALKPLVFLYVFKSIGAKHALYFDNDVWVTDSLVDLVYLLQSHLVVVTPHLSLPLPEDGHSQKDINILKAGVLNFGFIAFSASPQTTDFLQWWYSRLRFYGYVRLEKGMHFDQNWGHFILAFFADDERAVVRDHRYNIAYWNLHYTGARLRLLDGVPLLDGERCVFLHFSGVSLFEEFDMQLISRHQDRYTLMDFPFLEDILRAYTDHVLSFKVEKYRKLPYRFNYFDDGTIIPKIAWLLYQELTDEVKVLQPYALQTWPSQQLFFQALSIDPFQRLSKVAEDVPLRMLPGGGGGVGPSGSRSYLDYLLSGPYQYIIDLDGINYMSELEHTVYRSRPSLQQAYTDITGVHFWEYKAWFHEELLQFCGGKAEKKWKSLVLNARNLLKPTHKRAKIAMGVSIIGWCNGIFGVGISGASMFYALQAVGVPVDVVYMSGAEHHKHVPGRVPDSAITRSSAKPINIAVVNADNTPLLYAVYPEIVWKTHYNIAMWAWELDIFPAEWVKHMTFFDEVWVPSVFVKKAIEASPLYAGTPSAQFNRHTYYKPITVMPFGFYEKDEKWPSSLEVRQRAHSVIFGKNLEVRSEAFVFLAIFDYSSVFDRKNPLAAVKAFIAAFPLSVFSQKERKRQKKSTQEVVLIIKSSVPSAKFISERRDLIAAIHSDPRILLLERSLSDEEMLQLKARCDCYVSLHRSEGFGLNILHAMASEKPTIATNYGGNADFFAVSPQVLRQAHFPIAYDLVSPNTASGLYIYNPYAAYGTRWANPRHEEAVQAMKTVLSRGPQTEALARAKDALLAVYSREKVGEAMLRHLKLSKWSSKATTETEKAFSRRRGHSQHNIDQSVNMSLIRAVASMF